MKKIVITGGAGFIGRALTTKLLQEGYMVTIVDNFNAQVHGTDYILSGELFKHVHLIKGSILEESTLRNAFQGQQCLIHLAAHTATGQSMYKISANIDTNVLGTSKIMDYLINEHHCFEKIVFSSSRAVYGEGTYKCPQCGEVLVSQRNYENMDKGIFDLGCPNCGNTLVPMPTNELQRLNPLSIYGSSKVAAEQIISMSAQSIGLPYTILRYQNVYGAGQSLINPYTGILSVFATRLMNNKPLYIFEDGQQSRDFVYVDDVVQATIATINNRNTDNKIYNIGSGKRLSVLEIANMLIKETHSHSPCIITKKYRIGDIRHNYADISKANTDFSFLPYYDIHKGIKKFSSWFITQKTPIDRLDASLTELEQRKMLRGGLK